MFFTKILSGRVCPATESATVDNSSDETVAACENGGTCSLGNCNCCDTAEKKCKCIAGTYFQYGYVQNPYHCLKGVPGDYREDVCSANLYRLAWFSTDSSKTFYENGTCTITYRNVSDCKKKNDCDYKNDENRIQFELNDNSKIEMTKCALGAGKNPDDLKPLKVGDGLFQGGKYTHHDRLKIDGVEVVKFNRCIKNKSDMGFLDDGWTVPYRGDNACYWCSVQELYGKSNGNNDNVKDTDLKDMDYKKVDGLQPVDFTSN